MIPKNFTMIFWIRGSFYNKFVKDKTISQHETNITH